MAVQIGEEERREVPDRFLRTNLAEPPACEATADGKRQGDEFTSDEWRDSDNRPDDRTGVGAGEEAGEKRSRERQVGRVVIDQQSRDDTGGQREPKARGKDEAFGPIPLFGEQNPAEPRKSHQHRRQHRDNRYLDDQRRQEELPGRHRFRGLWHLMVNYNWLRAQGLGLMEEHGVLSPEPEP